MSILHNFKLTGLSTPFYISKKGNDSNSGLTPDLPRATIAQVAGRTHGIVGSGVYKGAFTMIATNPCNWYADNDVVLDFTGSFVTDINSINLIIGDNTIGGRFHLLLNNNTISIGANSQGTLRFNNSVVRDAIFSKSNTNASLLIQIVRSVLDNVRNNSWSNTRILTNNSLLFNTTLTNLPTNSQIISCYVDENTVITMNSYFTTPSNQFIANNFRGKFVVNNIVYELKRNRKGDLITDRIGNGILDLDVLHGGTGSLYTSLRCFAEDVQFLNIEKRDYFSVLPSSPNVYYDAAASTGNIGDVQTTIVTKITDTAFTTGTISNLVNVANDFVVGNAGTTGFAITKTIQLAPIIQQLRNINLHTVLSYNSSETQGSIENTNVTISNNYADGTAGANPKRLTFEIQWSTNNIAPTSDSDWTNGGLTLPNVWIKMEHNRVPQIDSAGRGNGEPDFNSITANNILAKYVRFKITIIKGI